MSIVGCRSRAFLGWAAGVAVIASHAISKNPDFLGKSTIGRLFPVKPNRFEYRALQPITIRFRCARSGILAGKIAHHNGTRLTQLLRHLSLATIIRRDAGTAPEGTDPARPERNRGLG